MRHFLLILALVMLTSFTYGQESEQMISITGGLANPIGGDDLRYWKTGFNVGAGYSFALSNTLWWGVQVDFSRFGFNPESYLNDWNKWWPDSQTNTNITGNGRSFYSISGCFTVMLADKSKIKPFIQGGMGVTILTSSIIAVNGEGKSFYSTYGNLGILAGAGIAFELTPRTSFIIETKYQKFVWPVNLEYSHSASIATIKTGMVFWM